MSPAELADRLIRLVEGDKNLPDSVRREASALREIAVANPERALERLRVVALASAGELPLDDPAEDLAKCLGIENYWAFYGAAEVKAVSPATYHLLVAASPDPGGRLMQDLKPDHVVIDSVHSWLVPLADIAKLDGHHLEEALAIRHAPPYSVLVFPLQRLRTNDVRVREPRSVDAVPEGLWEWREGGPSPGIRELIDRDVPRNALGRIEWRR